LQTTAPTEAKGGVNVPTNDNNEMMAIDLPFGQENLPKAGTLNPLDGVSGANGKIASAMLAKVGALAMVMMVGLFLL
jgi:hypothetical protein